MKTLSNVVNWACINSGETFQGLVGLIIQFEIDPHAHAFGKPGKDGGIDVLSSDKKIVYQAKYHQVATFAKILKDAKSEAKKIEAVLKQKNSLYQNIWPSAKQWVLVSNCTYNAADQTKWEQQIEPLFDNLGLKAEFWGLEKLEKYLLKHAQLRDAYFEGKNRSLFTFYEAFETEKQQQAHFVNAYQTECVGNQKAFADFAEFLEDPDKKVFLVSGPVGIGKTRFLFESAQRVLDFNGNPKQDHYQIYWGNECEMSESSDWYKAIIPEQASLLYLDDSPESPLDPKTIKRFLQQANRPGARTAKWKLIVATRSQSHIHHYLNQYQNQKNTTFIELQPLEKEIAIALCKSLLSHSKLSEETIQHASNWIYQKYKGFPFWTNLAAQTLLDSKDLNVLPENEYALINQYLKQSIYQDQDDFTAKEVKLLVRWIALLGKLDHQCISYKNEGREFNHEFDFLNHQLGFGMNGDYTKLKQILKYLQAAKLLYSHGRNQRFASIQPPVIQDYILADWLSIEYNGHYSRTDKAQEILNQIYVSMQQKNETDEQAQTSEIHARMFKQIAHLDYWLQLNNKRANILKSFLVKINDHLCDWPFVVQRDILSHYLPHASAAYTSDVLTICQTIANQDLSIAEASEIWNAIETCLKHAALYVDEPEQHKALLALLIQEIKTLSPTQDANTSTRMKSILSGLPEFYLHFETNYFEYAKKFLLELQQKNHLEPPDLAVLKHFVQEQFELERKRTYWNDKSSFTIVRASFDPSSPSWLYRSELLRLVFELLKLQFPPQDKIVFWNLVHVAISSAKRKQPSRDSQQLYGLYQEEVIVELSEVHKVLQIPEISLDELSAARKVWEWFYKYETEPNIKEAVQICEDWFIQHTPFAEFEYLFEPKTISEIDRRSNEKGSELAQLDASDIYEFVEKGRTYLAHNGHFSRLFGVARGIAPVAEGSKGVDEYIQESLKQEPKQEHFQFAATICRTRVWLTRRSQGGKNALELFQMFFNQALSSKQKVALVDFVYDTAWIGDISQEEFDFVVALKPYFQELDQINRFLRIIGGMALVDTQQFQKLVEHVLSEIQFEKKTDAILSLINSLSHIFTSAEGECLANIKAFNLDLWILNLIIQTPDLSKLSDSDTWFLSDFFEKHPKPDIFWFKQALEYRLALLKDKKLSTYRMFPYEPSLTSFVAKLDLNDFSSLEVKSVFIDLIKWILEVRELSDTLSEYITELDPEGAVVTDLLISFLENKAIQFDDAYELARIAGCYYQTESMWNKLAHSFCTFAEKLPKSQKERIWYRLYSSKQSVRFAPVCQVPKEYLDDIKAAELKRDQEKNLVLKPLRDWIVEKTKAEMQSHIELFKDIA